jgi:predicted aconitase with swiveling domain
MTGGKAAGAAVVSRKAFTFAHGVDPSSGGVTDVHSDIVGNNVKGKVLFYPFGKGSTTASSWFLETVRLGNGPAAVVTESVDLSAVIGSVLAKSMYSKDIPVLSSFPEDMLGSLRTGDRVSVDGSTGEIVIETDE